MILTGRCDTHWCKPQQSRSRSVGISRHRPQTHQLGVSWGGGGGDCGGGGDGDRGGGGGCDGGGG